MQQIFIQKNEAGQRLDKFLHKYMPLAPVSFFYKMLRKKNITLNGKKAEGREKLAEADCICLFLSEETIGAFREKHSSVSEYEEAFCKLRGIQILYEDPNILVMNKPAGILSQKAQPEDLSVNEWLIGYLLSEHQISEKELETYKPSVCNRLDRNTMGLIIGARTLAGSQKMSAFIRERKVRKFYRAFVAGKLEGSDTIQGYLHKDPKENKVYIDRNPLKGDAIETRYSPLKSYGDKTLLEIELITGKPHQIRAHLSSIGHPILGDPKYGNKAVNEIYKKKYGLRSQLLYACRIEFGREEELFEELRGRIICAPVPEIFTKLMS